MTGTILMIDDDPILLEMYEAVLSSTYTVLLAENVKKAIDLLSSQDVDAVGCDLHVGVDKGIEVLDWIGLNKPALMKKSVLISGDMLTCLSDLEVPVLIKPVQISKLQETFDQLLDGRELNYEI